MKRSTILVLGALVVPGTAAAQVSPAQMRSGADSTHVTQGDAPTDRSVFTVPAGSVFVLTDFESNDNRAFEICDNGSRVRARVPDHGVRESLGLTFKRPELHWNTGIVFAEGHQVVIRTWGVAGQWARYDWSGYLAPVEASAPPGR